MRQTTLFWLQEVDKISWLHGKRGQFGVKASRQRKPTEWIRKKKKEKSLLLVDSLSSWTSWWSRTGYRGRHPPPPPPFPPCSSTLCTKVRSSLSKRLNWACWVKAATQKVVPSCCHQIPLSGSVDLCSLDWMDSTTLSAADSWAQLNNKSLSFPYSTNFNLLTPC